MESDPPTIADSGVRSALKRSLLDLLSEKHLSRISVRELAARANIGRTTFYEYAAVIEEPQFSRVWMSRLGADPTSAPTLGVLMGAGIPRPQAEAVMLFQASGCLMVARSPFGKRDDWDLTRRTLDEFVSGGLDRLTKGAFPQ